VGHFKYALAKLKSLDGKEKSTAAKQLILNTFPVIDGRGRDLLKIARDAVTNGMVKDAAEALARVESEFAGREPAKAVPQVRAGLVKLAGGPEANKAAVAMQPQRLLYLDALMKIEEGDVATATKSLADFTAKYPDSPFLADAKAKLEEVSRAKGG
jgi:TolA-binding protein